MGVRSPGTHRECSMRVGARNAPNWKAGCARRSVRFLAGVVARARLDLIPLLVLDLDLAVGTVFFRVRGGVADVVLAALFGRYLIGGFPQLIELVGHSDHAPAGLLRQFAQLAFAGLAAK